MLTANQKKRQYKVRADQKDWRDYIYTPTRNPLKDRVDLRPWSSAVEDQGHLGSCLSNAIVGAYELLIKREAPTQYEELSRLFIYYNGRLLEGNVENDEGLYVRDGIKSVRKYGACSEKLWPYVIDQFAVTPTENCYQDARTRNIKNYYRIDSFEDILDALSNLHPVVFGIEIYGEFETTSNIVPIPSQTKEPLGGHAMCLVGYDMSKQLVLARNSFGKDWGLNGYCWIPFDYMRDETMDSWIFDIDLTNS
jgi:C1A family cysteine protease